MVHQEGYTFKKAADEMGLNQSTVRMIVRKYEREGVYFEKKEEKMKREQIEKAIKKY